MNCISTPSTIHERRIIEDTDAHRFDEIDGHAETADPLIERYARPRKEAQAFRVLDILDELERNRQ